MNRIQVHRRRFAYKVGDTFIGFVEQLTMHERLVEEKKRLSFAVPRPDMIDRAMLRKIIIEKLQERTQ